MTDHPSYPSELLSQAVEAIGTLPGVGSRSALRLALYLLDQPEENVSHFTGAIEKMRKEIKYCSRCHMISDTGICRFCSDHSRNASTICVVESIRDVMSIEGTGRYHGLYHVLGGIISPIHGIGPGDLSIHLLLQRIREHLEESPKEEPLEIIFALNGDVEGETTAFYLYRQIQAIGNVKITTLARGLGFGAGLEYADALTLGRSIESRQEFRLLPGHQGLQQG